MKTSSVSLALFTAALFAISVRAQTEMSATATATEAKPKPETQSEAGSNQQRREELIKRFDKNGDGKLDEEEKAAAHQAMRLQGGGPRGLAGTNPERIAAEVLKRFDRDGDGKLNEAELGEALKAFAERQKPEAPGGPGGRIRELLVRRFDKNGDGRLDEAEQAEAEKALNGFLDKLPDPAK